MKYTFLLALLVDYASADGMDAEVQQDTGFSIKFTLPNEIPTSGKIRITFPTAYSFNQDGTSVLTVKLGEEPTRSGDFDQWVFLYSENNPTVVEVVRNSDLVDVVPAGTRIGIKLTNVRNLLPDSATDFKIETLDESDGVIDASTVAGSPNRKICEVGNFVKGGEACYCLGEETICETPFSCLEDRGCEDISVPNWEELNKRPLRGGAR